MTATTADGGAAMATGTTAGGDTATATMTAMTADGGMAMATTIEMTDGAVTVIATATGIVTVTIGTGRN